jgi:hypothetical protein
MATTRIEHEFDCDEATFWRVTIFEDEFNKKLYFETLKFPVWKIVDQKITDDFVERKVEVQPLIEHLPSAMKKVMGDRFGYVEQGKLDRKANRYTFRVLPSAMPDKTHISGEMRTERLGDKKIRRVVDFSVEVKVMMIGKLIEQKTIDDTRASYDKGAVLLRQFLKEKGI